MKALLFILIPISICFIVGTFIISIAKWKNKKDFEALRKKQQIEFEKNKQEFILKLLDSHRSQND